MADLEAMRLQEDFIPPHVCTVGSPPPATRMYHRLMAFASSRPHFPPITGLGSLPTRMYHWLMPSCQENAALKDEAARALRAEINRRVKQLMNLMNEASKTPDGNVGTLFLRGKEYSAARQATGGQIGTAATATGIGGVAGGILGGAFTLGAILMAPVFLAKAAYNPKAVNRLLAFEKTKFKSTDAMEKAATLLIDDVVRGMNEYEAAQLRAELESQ